MRQTVRSLVGETTSLSVPLDTLSDDADLYEAGMSSLEVVTLIVAAERRFGIRFDADSLDRDTFRSIAAISAAVERLGGHG